ncbi:hypothetical protein C3K47_17265 [Solitalea longa]|uniref:Endo-alpha-mannosidase n=1 Tax=Solitalea longa TaxID=2079460 RepID=A0A2S4ZYD4_9SPHI|nr:glycoside hydrolase family 71/99-like protein [Solitalea longa]POY35007.1 hypothetical protein C3K47_17265 [Solitalea longa]
MKIHAWLLCAMLIVCACGKSSDDAPQTKEEFKVTTYPAEKVQKTKTQKVYVHLMPWFESKETSPDGKWGQHWTMANKNPDIINGSGQREIAAHFYPLTGPYASGDAAIIEYQLLLMKLSGIDGVFIDWPGTTVLYDYPLLVKNTEKLIAKLDKVGLTFAIVYEDQNINIAYNAQVIPDKLAAAQQDMAYLQSNYFNKSSYIKVNGKPLLMVFGPQTFTTENEWTNVFNGLSTKPAFFTLWNASGKAGKNATGEFGWVYKTNLTDLTNFYGNAYAGVKVASAYPGFKAFYTEGGWGSNPFTIDHNNISTFNATLDLALNSGLESIQLVTWNDYGEGTMLEPTKEFGYGFLTSLQSKLGVSYTQTELELIAKLYELRKKYPGSAENQKKLDQVFYYLVSNKITEAKALLQEIK